MEVLNNLVFDTFTWAGILAAVAAAVLACASARSGCCLGSCSNEK